MTGMISQDTMERVTAQRTTEPVVARLQRQDDLKDKYRIVIAAEDMGIDLSRMDVVTRYASNPIVLFNHDPFQPIGRTVRGPYYEGGRWIAEFVFAEGDVVAQRIRNLYDQRIVNAASIGFDILTDADGREYPLLVEWSVVYAGLDKSALALRHLNATLNMLEEQHMTNTATQQRDAAVEDEIAEDEALADDAAEEAADEESVADEAASQDGADDEDESDADADDDPEALAEGKQMYAGRMSDEETSEPSIMRSHVDRIVAEAVRRERVAMRAQHLIDDGTDIASATTRELLIAAVRSEVKDAESRSDDYLLGRLDAILERRERGIKVVTDASVKMGAERARPRSIRDVINMNHSEESNGDSN